MCRPPDGGRDSHSLEIGQSDILTREELCLPGTSSSGPTRTVAPLALAVRIDSKILSLFPWKSKGTDGVVTLATVINICAAQALGCASGELWAVGYGRVVIGYGIVGRDIVDGSAWFWCCRWL